MNRFHYSLYRLGAQSITLFSLRRVPDIFGLLQIIGPDMPRNCFPAGPALCAYLSRRAFFALIRKAFILPVPLSVCCTVWQAFILWADHDIQIFIIYIFVPFMEPLFGLETFVGQRRDPFPVYYLFADPRRFISCIFPL